MSASERDRAVPAQFDGAAVAGDFAAARGKQGALLEAGVLPGRYIDAAGVGVGAGAAHVDGGTGGEGNVVAGLDADVAATDARDALGGDGAGVGEVLRGHNLNVAVADDDIGTGLEALDINDVGEVGLPGDEDCAGADVPRIGDRAAGQPDVADGVDASVDGDQTIAAERNVAAEYSRVCRVRNVPRGVDEAVHEAGGGRGDSEGADIDNAGLADHQPEWVNEEDVAADLPILDGIKDAVNRSRGPIDEIQQVRCAGRQIEIGRGPSAYVKGCEGIVGIHAAGGAGGDSCDIAAD